MYMMVYTQTVYIYRYTVHWSTRRARQMNKICLLNTFSLGSDCVTHTYVYIYYLPHEEIKCIPSAEHNIQRLHTKIRIVRTYNVYILYRYIICTIYACNSFYQWKMYTYNVFTTFCDCLQRTETTTLTVCYRVIAEYAQPHFWHHNYEVIQITIFRKC